MLDNRVLADMRQMNVDPKSPSAPYRYPFFSWTFDHISRLLLHHTFLVRAVSPAPAMQVLSHALPSVSLAGLRAGAVPSA